ncbi:hypothetical protein D9M72_376820 [compost metagenome]
MCQLPCQRAVFCRIQVNGAAAQDRRSGVEVRGQQSGFQLLGEYAAQRSIDDGLVQRAVADPLEQRLAVAVHGGEFDVDPCLECQHGGIAGIGGHAVGDVQEGDPEVVGHHCSGEAPFLAEQRGEQRPVGGRRYAVDVRVGMHYGPRAAVLDGHLERRQHHVGKLARAHGDWRVVAPGTGGGVAHKVFQRGHDALGLQALDVGGRHGSHQVGVFADGFLHPSPAEVSHHVQHRGQALVYSQGPHVGADPGRHVADQAGVEGGAPGERHREGSGFPRGESGQAFLVHLGRNAEAGGGHDLFLRGGQAARALRRLQRRGAVHAGDLAEAVGDHVIPGAGVACHLALQRSHRVAVAGRVHPHARQLGCFFLEGHLADEAFDGVRPCGAGEGLFFGGTAGHGLLLRLEVIS